MFFGQEIDLHYKKFEVLISVLVSSQLEQLLHTQAVQGTLKTSTSYQSYVFRNELNVRNVQRYTLLC